MLYLRSGVIVIEFWVDLDVVVGDLEDVREVDQLFLDVITDETNLTTGTEQGFAFVTSKTCKNAPEKNRNDFTVKFLNEKKYLFEQNSVRILGQMLIG